MRNRIDRKWRKRVLSAALVLAMLLVTMLPELGAMTSKAASALDQYNAVTPSGGVVKAVRGVVDQLADLPQVKYGTGWESLPLGTADRPFTILEIVPYEEFAQLGYMIRGCEPVRLEDLAGTSSFNWGNIDAITGGGETNGIYKDSDICLYFFPDEPQGKKEFYNNKIDGNDYYGEPLTEDAWKNYQQSASIKIKGYYEVIDTSTGATGTFINQNGKLVRPEETDGSQTADIVWHTINEVDEKYEFAYTGFNPSYAPLKEELPENCLKKPGDLFYTYRQGGESDPYVKIQENNRYHYYFNKDGFVTDVIGVPASKSATYSVVIKTITPKELSEEKEAGNDWVKYADLIYISPKEHNGTYSKMWQSKVALDGMCANRLKKSPSATSYSDGFKSDIDYDVMKEIFYKATASENYAGVIFDSTIAGSYAGQTKTCTYKLLDYNFMESLLWGQPRTESALGYKDNITKLWLILNCENPRVIRKIYFEKGKIEECTEGEDKGKAKMNTQGSDDANLYWSPWSFILLDPDMDPTQNNSVAFENDAMWNAYKATTQPTQDEYQTHVFDHAYSFKGDNSLTQTFLTGATGSSGAKYTEFNYYAMTDPDTKRIWEERHPGENYHDVVGKDGKYANNVPPSAALRYILNLGENSKTPTFKGTLNVLNVEPSVGLQTNYQPDWKEDSLKTLIQLLLPNYTGTDDQINITSMTMSTFVGKTDDLSNYDLIYFGKNSDGFWKGQGSNQSKTDFHDDAMDGMLYFHMGDTMTGGKEKSGSQIKRTAQFIEGASDETLRFPGNDITHLMIRKLEDYMAAGHPVVAENQLFTASDPSSYMREFLNGHYVSPGTSVYGEGSKRLFKLEGTRIEENVRNARITVNFDIVPPSFVEGVTSSYLNPDGGAASLDFTVNIPGDQTGQFAYNLYVDQDRNAKFETGEKVKSGMSLAVGEDEPISYSLSSEIVGFVQWRLEVYRQDNPKLMKSVEGGSAIKRNASKEKEKIHVLQILPNSGTVTANLKDPEYAGLYANLDAFEIEVDTITLGELDEIFEAAGGFSFQAGSEISTENPSVDQLKNLNDKYSEKYETKYGTERSLDYYNMIVVGFADAYGETDITNENGLVEYLYYFAAKDMSILFTHDNTSLYNGSNAVGNMGFTANAMMRDIMGMNRYGVNTLNSGTNGIVSAEWLNAYRAKVQAKYTHEDGTTDFEYDKAVFNGSELTGLRQGFTINALRKAGYNDDASGGRLPYMYMVKDANGGNEGTNEYITEIHESQNGEKSPITSKTGFFTSSQVEKEGETTRANRVNMGQITQYPYNIGNDSIGMNLTIAPTHAQWYLLNMEDPEVTVWYTLGYNGTSDSYAKIYAASPMDVANNYYIYSKGNIFYSGVGHSDTEGAGGSEEERQLFINTMIAAYRRGAQPPEIVVTNANKVNGSSSADYMIRVLQELDQDDSGNAVAGEALDGSSVRVVFKAVDISLAQDIMVHIESGNGTVITEIKPYNWEGVSLTKGDDGFIHKLENEKEYYFDYEKSNLTAAGGSIITFTTKNDKIDETGETKLEIKPQPLVLLD